MSKKLDIKALWEVAKFVGRFTAFFLPAIITWLTDSGYTAQAIQLGAVWATLDKYIHLAKNIKANGLWFF
jgi:hypothetical protein